MRAARWRSSPGADGSRWPREADALTRDLLAATAGRTVLLITHRPVNPADVDQVARLQEGRVVPAPQDESHRVPWPLTLRPPAATA
jgi:hypothetical protein